MHDRRIHETSGQVGPTISYQRKLCHEKRSAQKNNEGQAHVGNDEDVRVMEETVEKWYFGRNEESRRKY